VGQVADSTAGHLVRQLAVGYLLVRCNGCCASAQDAPATLPLSAPLGSSSGVSVHVQQVSCRASFPLCTLCNPFSGAPECLFCQQPLSVAKDGTCGARFTLLPCAEAGVLRNRPGVCSIRPLACLQAPGTY